MDSVDLLKSTSFKYGASTQNEMLLSEMKHVVKEIKNLAEVFQVCGERFVFLIPNSWALIRANKVVFKSG